MAFNDSTFASQSQITNLFQAETENETSPSDHTTYNYIYTPCLLAPTTGGVDGVPELGVLPVAEVVLLPHGLLLLGEDVRRTLEGAAGNG